MRNLFRKNSIERIQLNWQERPDGILFTDPSENLSLTEYTTNLPTDAHQAQAQWLLLKELLDNGQAESLDNGILIPNEEVLQLESVDQEKLGLPELYPFDIEIRSHGTFNQAEFRYKYQFLKPDLKPLHPNRIGCVLRLTKKWAYLLTNEQYVLLDALDAFNSREEIDKDFQSNLLEFAKIKGLAKGIGAALDLYLNQEEVVAPKTVRLRLREAGDDVEIIPDVAGVDSDKFEETFDKFANPQNTYNISQPGGGRTRVLFPEKQREALESIKENRRVSREQLAEMAKHPQEYFDPEIIELDPTDDTLSFSERVREIGIYQPRVYPFISPYKSEWIPGILVEDDESGERTKIQINDDAELTELKTLISEANRTGRKQVTWKGKQIPTSDLEEHLPFIEDQLKHRKKRTHISSGEKKTAVLIIDENIVEPDYVVPEGSATAEPFRHRLEQPPNLKKEFNLLPHQEEGLAWI